MMFVEILIGGRSFEQINIMCISENTSFNDGMNLGLCMYSGQAAPAKLPSDKCFSVDKILSANK